MIIYINRPKQRHYEWNLAYMYIWWSERDYYLNVVGTNNKMIEIYLQDKNDNFFFSLFVFFWSVLYLCDTR